MDLIQWIVLGGGVLVFLFALLVLCIVVVIKVRRGRASASVAPQPSIFGETLRQRMEREDREEAERVVNALYATGRYMGDQADRDAKMKALAGSLKGMFGAPSGSGAAPNP